MAGKGLLALLAAPKSKGSAGSLPGESAGPGSAPLDSKAAALKAMWSNMKAGDFEAAALDFQDAYDACAMATEDEGDEYEEDEALEEEM